MTSGVAGTRTLGQRVDEGPARPLAEYVLYSVVDRHDTKQYRELYATTQAVVDAMKAGKALPDGTVLTLVQYKAQVDAAGRRSRTRRALRQGRPHRRRSHG